MKATCSGTTKAGKPCPRSPLQGERWCWNCHPAKAEERAAARRLGGARRRRPKVGTQAGAEVRMRSVDDVLGLLEDVVADTQALENSVARSRAMAYLLAQGLRALEVGELEERISALEAQLGAHESGGAYGEG